MPVDTEWAMPLVAAHAGKVPRVSDRGNRPSPGTAHPWISIAQGQVRWFSIVRKERAKRQGVPTKSRDAESHVHRRVREASAVMVIYEVR